jgi:hypothetical protein
MAGNGWRQEVMTYLEVFDIKHKNLSAFKLLINFRNITFFLNVASLRIPQTHPG